MLISDETYEAEAERRESSMREDLYSGDLVEKLPEADVRELLRQAINAVYATDDFEVFKFKQRIDRLVDLEVEATHQDWDCRR